MKIRKAKIEDTNRISELYLKAAAVPDGLARKPDEISKELIESFIKNSLDKGLIFVIENNYGIIAEIHCFKMDPLCFQHCLGNLTIVVHPDFHGQSLGRQIFNHLLNEVKNKHQNIARIELFVRQENPKAIKFYQSLGFEVEGICKNRLLNSKAELSDDTLMAWLNPNFNI